MRFCRIVYCGGYYMKQNQVIFLLGSVLKKINPPKKYILLIPSICVLCAFLQAISSLVIAPLINTAVSLSLYEAYPYILRYVLFSISYVVALSARKIIFSFFSKICGYRLNSLVTESVFNQNMTYFFSHNEGSTIATVNKRIPDFENILIMNLGNIIYSPVSFAFIFSAILLLNYKIGMIIIPTIMLSTWVDLHYGNKLLDAARKAYNAEKSMYEHQKEFIEDVENIQLTMAEGFVSRIYKITSAYFLERKRIATKQQQKAYIPALLNEYLPTIMLALIYIFRICKSAASYGEFLSMLSLVNSASLPFANFLRSIIQMKSQEPLLKEIIEILPSNSNKHEQYKCSLNNAQSNGLILEMDNISFIYPGSDRVLFNNCTLSVKPGEKVAVVGRSGSGKSTLLKLILGIYKPTFGNVKVFGFDISQDQSQACAWKQIAYVDSHNFLFDKDIVYNITLINRPLYPNEEEKLHCICSQLRIDKLLSNTKPLQQFGSNLSGGQKLKISLARALFKNARLLVLDEPTSSLDVDTEEVFSEIVKRSDLTMIIATHRVKLIEACSRIVEITDSHKIKDHGNSKIKLDFLNDGV